MSEKASHEFKPCECAIPAKETRSAELCGARCHVYFGCDWICGLPREDHPPEPAPTSPMLSTQEEDALWRTLVEWHARIDPMLTNGDLHKLLTALKPSYLAARSQGRSDRDMQWWEAVGGVDTVAPTPEACKRWQVSLHDLARQSGAEAMREAAANLLEQPGFVFAFEAESIRNDVVRRVRSLPLPTPPERLKGACTICDGVGCWTCQPDHAPAARRAQSEASDPAFAHLELGDSDLRPPAESPVSPALPTEEARTEPKVSLAEAADSVYRRLDYLSRAATEAHVRDVVKACLEVLENAGVSLAFRQEERSPDEAPLWDRAAFVDALATEIERYRNASTYYKHAEAIVRRMEADGRLPALSRKAQR